MVRFDEKEDKYYTICDDCGKINEVKIQAFRDAKKKEKNYCRSCSQKGNRNHRFGKDSWNKGLTKETDERVKQYGEKVSVTKKGVPNIKNRKVSYKTTASKYIYKSLKGELYTNWTRKIMERDNFQCVDCKSKTSLEVHHIKPFREILAECLTELNMIFDEYQNWTENEIHKLKNLILEKHTLDIGITYCVQCHSKHDKFRKRFLNKKEINLNDNIRESNS